MAGSVEVVISGASCRLPESDNVDEFTDNLYGGVDMVTEGNPYWDPDTYGLPKRCGTLKSVEKFDAAFFGVSPKQASTMDPQLRMLLELSYEAMVDSGTNPQSMRGSNTGVFMSTFQCEAQELLTADPHQIKGYEMTGCARSMLSNRLSYYFHFHGPSYVLDTACSSGLLALCQALRAIRQGQCEAALVGGCNLLLKPTGSLQFLGLKMLTMDGKCKVFDSAADGYVRSEGLVVFYLQKASSAKRIYASLVHALDNCDGFTEEGITYPSGQVQRSLMSQTCQEAGIDPKAVTYIEAHGTGTAAGDPQEVGAIADVYCRNREGKLLIGSVKSNVGHTEATSGLVGVLKVLLGYKKKLLPGNLHLKNLNPEIPALHDGKLEVVTENTVWEGGLAAVSSFGFGGLNVHLLLAPPEVNNGFVVDVPNDAVALTLITGRTEDSVNKLVTVTKSNGGDLSVQSLVAEATEENVGLHPWRAYAVANKHTEIHEKQKCPPDKPPLWFVFPGMGSQWHGMGRVMMRCCPPFKQSIIASDAALQPYGFSLINLLNNQDETVFSSPQNSFVGITSIQVALVDSVRAYGLEPDGMVGHSVGELACAYTDGTLTAKQTIQAAYWRGRCIEEANLQTGAMAAIGMTWEDTKIKCPPGIVPACHNAKDSVTISGPKDLLHMYVQQLQEQGVFAREVNTSGVAFHSYLLKPCAPALKEALEKIITKPKPRSKKWISSSVPEVRWNEESASHSSASYHVNNFLNPVMFSEALSHIPAGSVILEIGPHGLLGTVVKRQRVDLKAILSVMKRKHQNNFEFFLSNLGKCYLNGLPLKKKQLLPEIQYPVSLTTPCLSSQIVWKHEQDWTIPRFSSSTGHGTEVEVSLDPKNEYHYITDHRIDGRVLFPAAGYIYLAWTSFAKMKCSKVDATAVSIRNFKIERATVVSKSDKVNLKVEMSSTSGRFEITEEEALVASGEITPIIIEKSETPAWVNKLKQRKNKDDDVMLDADDVYKELRIRGYDYGPHFKEIISMNCKGTKGIFRWNDNWVTFVDAFLQSYAFNTPDRTLRLPNEIDQLDINPALHKTNQENTNRKNYHQFTHDCATGILRAGGVKMKGVQLTTTPKHNKQKPTLHEMKFIPYKEEDRPNRMLSYLEECTNLAEKYLMRIDPTGSLSSPYRVRVNGQTNGIFHSQHVKYRHREQKDKNKNVFACMLEKCISKNVHGFVPVDTEVEGLAQDPLVNQLLCPSRLEPYLGIAAENISSLDIDLLVIEPDVLQSQLSAKSYLENVTAKSAVVQYRTSYNVIKTNVIPSDESVNITDLAKTNPHKFDVIFVNSLTLCSCKHSTDDTISKLSSVLNDKGFVILQDTTGNEGITKVLSYMCGVSVGQLSCVCCNNKDATVAHFERGGFDLVAYCSEGLLSSQYLFRKKSTEKLEYSVLCLKGNGYGWVQELQLKLKEVKENKRNLWIISPGESYSGLLGLISCLKLEPHGNQIRCLLNSDQSKKLPEELLPGSEGFEELLETDLVMNVYKDGQLGSYRHVLMKNEQTKVAIPEARLRALSRRDSKSLLWSGITIPSNKDVTSKDNKVEVTVHYSALNFRDLMLKTGRIHPDSVSDDPSSTVTDLLGLEFAGRDDLSNRIMGICSGGALTTKIKALKGYTWRVPSSWSLEGAATVPVAYSTAFYSLVVRGGVKSGDTLLIHSAASSMGQAAINVAKSKGCTVYVTVGTEQKARYLQKNYGISSKHIFYSRNTDFTKYIMDATDGRGVDMIINTLSGEKLFATVELLADGGRFLELGKFDLQQNTGLGMRVFLKNASFHGVVLEHLLKQDSKSWPQVWRLVEEGIQKGVVKPLKVTVYDMEDHEAAFRLMAEGTHIGKILLRMRTEKRIARVYGLTKKNKIKTQPLSIEVSKTSSFEAQKTFIVTGGLGGLGLEMCLWMVKRGAKNIVVTSRHGIKTGYQKYMVQQMESSDCKITVAKLDVRNLKQTKELILHSAKTAPIGGIFHLAAVLNDGHFENQTSTSFSKVCDPKIEGILNLDKVSRTIAPGNLEYFVAFSSLASGFGNAGQTNYGYANSFMEHVCEKRRQDGLPGLAIQWGFIGDVGIVQDQLSGNDMYMSGVVTQRIPSFLETLDLLLQSDVTVVSSVAQEERQKQWSSVEPGKHMEEEIVTATLEVLGISSSEDVDPDAQLSDLGLDSLMTTEIRQVLGRQFAIQLTVSEVQQLTVIKLKHLANKAMR